MPIARKLATDYYYSATLFYVHVAFEIQWRRGFAIGDRIPDAVNP